MQSFVDAGGRRWVIQITIADVKRVRLATEVDLLRLLDDGLKPLGDLLADLVLFADVLYVLLKPEADAAGISDEDFGHALYGDALDRAEQAFLEALTDFFPEARKRGLLKSIIAKIRKAREISLGRAEVELQSIDVEDLASGLNDSSGKPLVISESTQAP
jgi:hypothetical protein